MPYDHTAVPRQTRAGGESQIESQWQRIWRAADSVRDCVAAFLIENGLRGAHAYIAETRSAHPEPNVFTFAATDGAAHASCKISASQIDRNQDDIAIFALLVAHCLYQRLTSH
jgi:hypothetical protein